MGCAVGSGSDRPALRCTTVCRASAGGGRRHGPAPAAHQHSNDFGTFEVEVRSPGLALDASAISYRGDGLAEFVGELAGDWRGWEGTRRWESLEEGLAVEATHRGSRIELVFVLRG